MKIISLGLDNSALSQDSILAKKTIEYGDLVEKYILIVPSENDKAVDLSDKVRVYGVGGKNRLVKLWNMYRLAKLQIEEKQCNVVTTQEPFELGFLGYLLKCKYKIGWNCQEHGDFFSQGYWKNESLLNFFRFFLGKFLIKKADSIRVVSKRQKEYLVNNLHIKNDSIVVVPVLTELQDLGQSAEASPESDKEFIFLNMGRFVKQKNLLLLIDSFFELRSQFENAKLILIGKGPLEKQLKNRIELLGLGKAVEMKPWVDDVASYYKKADAYVLSSNYEGWGRVIVEAANFNLPIVMTDVGCASELIIDNESGLVTPVGDKHALVQAMGKSIMNKQSRIAMVVAAKKTLETLPDKPRSLELYKESWLKAL